MSNQFILAGEPLDFTGPWPVPRPVTLSLGEVVVRPLKVEDAAAYAQDCAEQDPTHEGWRFLPSDPPSWDQAGFEQFFASRLQQPDLITFAMTHARDDRPFGMAALMSAVPQHGVIELGWIHLQPRIRMTTAATAALFLLMDHALFGLQYRRLEWKCDCLNHPSRRAAFRLGFHYEGRFRQHRVVRGKSRDTDWFAITHCEWHLLRQAFVSWFDPAGFDPSGRQVQSLSDITRAVRSRIETEIEPHLQALDADRAAQ